MSIEDYHCFVFGLLTGLMTNEPDELLKHLERFGFGYEWFPKDYVSENKIDVFFREVSDPLFSFPINESADHGPNDFTCFKNKPFYKYAGSFYPVDFHFVASKAEAGVYWHIADGTGTKKERFFEAFGEMFARYVSWILNSGATGTFKDSPTYLGRPADQVCDGLFIEGENAVLLE